MSAKRTRIDTNALKQTVNLLAVAERYTSLKQISSQGEFAGPCPRCGGRDRFHVKVDAQGGRFYCRHCYPRGGDVIDLVCLVEGVSFKEACERLAAPFSERPTPLTPAQPKIDAKEAAPIWPDESFQASAKRTLKATQRLLLSHEGTVGQQYLLARGLTLETWRTYQLGFGTTFHPLQRRQMDAIFIPWFTANQVAICAIQHRFLDPTLAQEERYCLKAGSEPLVFGLQALGSGDSLVIVEGEFNGMALHQVGLQAVSVGSETNRSHLRTLALLQAQLAPYQQIAVWLDQPAAGHQLAEQLQQSQPFPKEISVVESHGQDANDLLRTGELSAFLRSYHFL